MTAKTTVYIVCAALAWTAIGCDVEDASLDDAGDAVAPRKVAFNGWSLNGWRLNGWRLNGWRLNGSTLQGDPESGDSIRTVGIDLPGTDEGEFAWLVGSSLHVKSYGGKIMTATKLLGTELLYEIVEGGLPRDVRVKITGVTLAQSDVWNYDLQISDSGGPWEPLCTDLSGAGVPAVLLGDVWDPDTGARLEPTLDMTLTFACRGSALEKCVDLGYRPWSSKSGVSLRDHHQACTRMIRADYCGDGESHTVDRTPIHVLDKLGIQKEDAAQPYAVEAEWTPNGASCLNYENARVPNPAIACSLPACGAQFGAGLLQSGSLLASP